METEKHGAKMTNVRSLRALPITSVTHLEVEIVARCLHRRCGNHAILTIQNLKSFNASFFISHKAKKKHTIQLIRIGKSNQNWLPNKFQSHALQIKNNLPDSLRRRHHRLRRRQHRSNRPMPVGSDYGEEKCNSYCCIICKLTRNGTERKQMWHWHAMAICLLWV